MVDVLGIIGGIFLEGLRLFASPYLHPMMLWVVVPIMINLIATELFQERGGTGMGNAMTNGVIAIWVAIDWTRNLMLNFSVFDLSFAFKAFLCVFMFLFGIAIIVLGLKNSKIIRYIGRIREITYFNLMLTPIVYGFFEFTGFTIAAIIIYFPIFYLFIALLNKLIPKLKFEKEKEEEETELPKAESEKELEEFSDAALSGEKQAQQSSVPTCPYCDKSLRFIPQYQKYWCDNCRRYV